MPQVHDIIKRKPYLAWDIKDISALSDESVLEHVLNHGSWDDVQEFIAIKGHSETARLFKTTINRRRTNYYPEIKAYFTRYFTQTHV